MENSRSGIGDPGSGINIPDHIFKSFASIFRLKVTKFLVAVPDPGPFLRWIRDGKIRTRD
jgi:hypothetical protein